MYATCMMFFSVFFYLFIPETSGLTLEQVIPSSRHLMQLTNHSVSGTNPARSRPRLGEHPEQVIVPFSRCASRLACRRVVHLVR
ncbi:hypothetical protein T484DRAFT_2374935 [Baffinella frigidus]|nr:hypothetical protein T484DRAFT_2374935 [Cryptophyta sp. CCMP2293]